MSIIEILERFPPELRQPLAQLLDALKEEWGVKRVDIEDLKAVVRDLAQAQRELAQAQRRTEARVEELAQAQKELAEAQTRFALIQQRQAEELAAFRRTFLFERKAMFYARKTGRHVDRKIVVTPSADRRALEVATRLGVEVCTDVHALQEE